MEKENYTDKDIQVRKEKLLQDAAYYRGQTFTLVKMTEYYGQKYADALEKANKGEAYAFCLLGQMFEDSVHHARQKRDYDYPPIGYDEAAKIYYELAVLSGYSRGAYYLGESYREGKDYKQSEKWLLYAAEQNITEAYYALGKVYQEMWKQEHLVKHLERAQIWKQKALELEGKVVNWMDMADFYKDILINGEINEPEKKRGLLSKMTEYYLKAAGPQNHWMRRRVNEELVSVFLGDYGNQPDVEKAFLYGNAAMRERSSYAAFRLGQYLVENKPSEQEKIIYYLERAVDYPGSVEGSRELLQDYLRKNEVASYLCTEAFLLMEADSFVNLGRIYQRGEVVEKDMQTALYYYTRAMEGCEVKEDIYIEKRYNIAYYFMMELHKEGISVPQEAWEEIKSRREEEKFNYGFSEEAACILADLNLKYNIIDMDEFQKHIQDIEPVFAIPDDKVCDLQSDYYSRGFMRETDQKYLQKYVSQMFAQLVKTESDEEVIIIYQDLVALADYAAGCTKAAGSVQWGMRNRIARIISDVYLDKMINKSLQSKITKCLGKAEKDYRTQCHAGFNHNWPAACEKVKEMYTNFLA